MSTILEALKKSEQERKLNDVPNLSNMAAPQENSRWPLIVLISLIVILLIVLGILAFNWFALSEQVSSGVIRGTPTTPVEITNKTLGDSSTTTESNDIVVNVLSYSERSEQRFAVINGKLFKEGEFVRGGLRVEEIKADEVVLNLRGRRIIRRP